MESADDIARELSRIELIEFELPKVREEAIVAATASVACLGFGSASFMIGIKIGEWTNEFGPAPEIMGATFGSAPIALGALAAIVAGLDARDYLRMRRKAQSID